MDVWLRLRRKASKSMGWVTLENCADGIVRPVLREGTVPAELSSKTEEHCKVCRLRSVVLVGQLSIEPMHRTIRYRQGLPRTSPCLEFIIRDDPSGLEATSACKVFGPRGVLTENMSAT